MTIGRIAMCNTSLERSFESDSGELISSLNLKSESLHLPLANSISRILIMFIFSFIKDSDFIGIFIMFILAVLSLFLFFLFFLQPLNFVRPASPP